MCPIVQARLCSSWFLLTLFFVVLAVDVRTVDAAVVGKAAHGFQIEFQTQIAAPPDKVYDALVNQVGRWWDGAHTYSGDSSNLYLEAAPKGWFGEKLREGGFVRHLEVAYVAPNRAIRLLGGLGPLQPLGVDGALTFMFRETEDGCELRVVYGVSGFAPGGLESLAAPVERVLSGQMGRLKEFVEKPGN